MNMTKKKFFHEFGTKKTETKHRKFLPDEGKPIKPGSKEELQNKLDQLERSHSALEADFKLVFSTLKMAVEFAKAADVGGEIFKHAQMVIDQKAPRNRLAEFRKKSIFCVDFNFSKESK